LILIQTLGLLIFWVRLLMAIMSWVSQGRSPVEYSLIQLADPLLRPIRNLLPAMGGIDFSPMILVLLLYVINMGIAELLQSTGNSLLPGRWMAVCVLSAPAPTGWFYGYIFSRKPAVTPLSGCMATK